MRAAKLARQFVASLAPHGTAPLLRRTIAPAEMAQAKRLSRLANDDFDAHCTSPIVPLEPAQLEELVFLNVCGGRHAKVLELSRKVRNDPVRLRFCTPTLYVLVLRLLAARQDRSDAPLVLALYREMHTRAPLPEQSALATELLFSYFRNCSDFTQLLPLRAVYESVTVRHAGGIEVELQYVAATVHVLLNLGQYFSALAVYENCLAQFDERHLVFSILPMERLRDAMCAAADTASLVALLQKQPDLSSVTFLQWSQYLGLGLHLNDYTLVKFIYMHAIMAGHEGQLSLDDVVLGNKIGRILSESDFFSSLSETTISEILRTLASHGDVALALNLIELHYMHKSMRGEAALTKDLSLNVIDAYCYYDEGAPLEDVSVKRVIDVVESFVSRQDPYSYNDISDAFSHKLNNYKHFDANVKDAATKAALALERDCEEEAVGLPDKKSNTNVVESSVGSVLKNKLILADFIGSHVQYIKQKSYSKETLALFLNCLLCHLQKYQNTSGVIFALSTLKLAGLDRNEWMNPDMLDILLFSIANSPASTLTGLELYQHLIAFGTKVTSFHMECLIYSALRGKNFNSIFEYYIYEYLKMHSATVASRVIERIKAFRGLNGAGEKIVLFLEHGFPGMGQVDQFWDAHGFAKQPKMEHFYGDSHAHYLDIDQRDLGYLMDALQGA